MKIFLFAVVTVFFLSSLAFAESNEEARLKQLAPYSEMKKLFPVLTMTQYNETVREVVQNDSSQKQIAPKWTNTYSSSVSSYTPSYNNQYSKPSYNNYYTPSYSNKYSAPSTKYNYSTPSRTYSPQSGSAYDWKSGSLYNWRKQYDGSTKLNGYNLNTGSSWTSTYKKDGSSSGYDKNFNYWNYDNNSKIYMNYGTGEICVGEGASRICSGGD